MHFIVSLIVKRPSHGFDVTLRHLQSIAEHFCIDNGGIGSAELASHSRPCSSETNPIPMLRPKVWAASPRRTVEGPCILDTTMMSGHLAKGAVFNWSPISVIHSWNPVKLLRQTLLKASHLRKIGRHDISQPLMLPSFDGFVYLQVCQKRSVHHGLF